MELKMVKRYNISQDDMTFLVNSKTFGFKLNEVKEVKDAKDAVQILSKFEGYIVEAKSEEPKVSEEKKVIKKQVNKETKVIL